MNDDAYDSVTGEIVPSETNVLEAITRAEVDIAITTAKRYPRDIAVFQQSVERIISDPEIAQGCGFRLPVGKGVEGPSIRLAEIMAPCWQNMRVASRTIDVGKKSIRIQATAKDWQSNYEVYQEVERQIVDKTGKRFEEHLINRTIMAAQAIGRRNVIFQIIPREFVNKYHERAKEIAIQDPEALLKTRDKWLAYFEAGGVSRARVLAHFEVANMKNLSAQDVVSMKGYADAIKEGLANLDDIFPADQAPQGEDLESLMNETWIPEIPKALKKAKLPKAEQDALVRSGMKAGKSAEEMLAVINTAIANRKSDKSKTQGRRKKPAVSTPADGSQTTGQTNAPSEPSTDQTESPEDGDGDAQAPLL